MRDSVNSFSTFTKYAYSSEFNDGRIFIVDSNLHSDWLVGA